MGLLALQLGIRPEFLACTACCMQAAIRPAACQSPADRLSCALFPSQRRRMNVAPLLPCVLRVCLQ